MFVLMLKTLGQGIRTARGAISGRDSIVHTTRTVVESLYRKCRVQLQEDALVHRHLGTRVNGRVDHSN